MFVDSQMKCGTYCLGKHNLINNKKEAQKSIYKIVILFNDNEGR